MTAFGIILFCIQACLIQNVFSQCPGPSLYESRIAGSGYIGTAAPDLLNSPGYPAYPGISCPGYGGAGSGVVAVVGDLPVVGTTLLVGAVPVLGAVQFVGPVPAAGSVTVSGFCNLGCNPSCRN